MSSDASYTPSQTKRYSAIAQYVALGLAIFLILFPKGGFKAGPVPITWGYGLVAVAVSLGSPWVLLTGRLKTHPGTVGAFLALAPLQVLFIYSLVINGIGDTGFALSDIVCFFVLPFAFLVVFPRFYSCIHRERLLKFVSWLVFLAAAYGLFLFVWRFVTGSYIEIPYLTVNVGDIGTLDEKYNARPDGLFKLISTYNNGNQYGVATLLLLPLVDAVDKSRFRKVIIRCALMLTLSRTIWIGVVLNELLDVLRYLAHDLSRSKRLSIRASTFFRLLRLAIPIAAVVGLTYVFSGLSFLFDPSLGGRDVYFDTMGAITFMPSAPVAQFAEIIYLSALTMLGVAGVLAILLLFGAPIALAVRFSELRRTRVQIAALQGLVIYIPVAAMDGALNYIPTMAFYWFLWMLLLRDGQSARGSGELGCAETVAG